MTDPITAASATPHSPTPGTPLDFGGKRAPLGEAQVWLTSMGLALGILMTLFLLGLILYKGAEVFWPHRVGVVTLTSTPNPGDGPAVFAGIKTLEQETGGTDRRRETQFFTGNRDAYRQSFRFVDTAAISSVEFPEDIVVAERLEYGDSIFFPVSVTGRDGATVPATEDGFIDAFRSLVDEAEERRDTIHSLEKKTIGRINREIADANGELRALARAAGTAEAPDTPEAQALRSRLEELNTTYTGLAAQAEELRGAQDESTLVYRLASGEERSQPIGDLITFHLPNQLSFMERVGLFFENLWVFVSEDPREANTEGGIFPAIFGTFVMTLFMSIAVTPFGVIAAIYLREYAKQGILVQSVRISVNNLAGVPSIVFGVFGLGFFVYGVGSWIDGVFFPNSVADGRSVFGTGGVLWASLTLAVMTLPVVIVATEEALAAVPRGVREAALACGASKWQTIQRVVLPSATPGILTGVILSMARGAGEVAPLMLVGVVKSAESLPIDGTFPFLHLDRKFMHLGFHIYDLGFQSPDSEAAKPMVFATTFLLITLVVVMNLAAILLRNRLRKKYAMASF